MGSVCILYVSHTSFYSVAENVVYQIVCMLKIIEE